MPEGLEGVVSGREVGLWDLGTLGMEVRSGRRWGEPRPEPSGVCD